MVDLRVDGVAPVSRALDHMRFPQRPVAVEQGAVQPGGQFQQLPDPSRRGQGGAAHVILDVDFVVEFPCHVGESAERLGRTLAESRLDVPARQHRFIGLQNELRSGAVRRREHLQTADVHRVLASFADQEHRIHGRHEFHRSFPCSFRHRRRRGQALFAMSASSGRASQVIIRYRRFAWRCLCAG